MRVGLLGGSFNPAHEGHRHVSDTARRALGLDKVIWLVTLQNPLKAAGPNLVKRAASARRVAGRHAIVSTLEADLGSPYTVHTLAWLRRRFPAVRFYFLIGTDNLLGFRRWKRWREIPRLAEIAVVSRPGSTVRGRLSPAGRTLRKSGRARFVEAPLHPTSSTALRKSGMALDT